MIGFLRFLPATSFPPCYTWTVRKVPKDRTPETLTTIYQLRSISVNLSTQTNTRQPVPPSKKLSFRCCGIHEHLHCVLFQLNTTKNALVRQRTPLFPLTFYSLQHFSIALHIV